MNTVQPERAEVEAVVKAISILAVYCVRRNTLTHDAPFVHIVEEAKLLTDEIMKALPL